jgi:hypothetical protein
MQVACSGSCILSALPIEVAGNKEVGTVLVALWLVSILLLVVSVLLWVSRRKQRRHRFVALAIAVVLLAFALVLPLGNSQWHPCIYIFQEFTGIPRRPAPPPEFTGTWVWRWGNGSMERRVPYVDGAEHGVAVTYTWGRKTEECPYVHGQAEGVMRCWSSETGRMVAEYHFKAGRLHGWGRDWLPTGELLFEACYHNGEVVAEPETRMMQP